MATSANFGSMFSVAGASLFLSFLPMLPKQILSINFLTDLPEMSIASDNVDDVFIQRPHRWDVGFKGRFMLVFGPLSSIFDLLTFGVLLLLLHADQSSFHTGWFIEPIFSAAIVVFAVRTRLPFIRSQPSRTMMLVTLDGGCGNALASLFAAGEYPWIEAACPFDTRINHGHRHLVFHFS